MAVFQLPLFRGMRGLKWGSERCQWTLQRGFLPRHKPQKPRAEVQKTRALPKRPIHQGFCDNTVAFLLYDTRVIKDLSPVFRSCAHRSWWQKDVQVPWPAEFSVSDLVYYRPVLQQPEVSLILEQSSLTFQQLRWKMVLPPDRPADLGGREFPGLIFFMVRRAIVKMMVASLFHMGSWQVETIGFQMLC